MGWRGGGGGRAGRWPGRGPFSHLTPWQRPGWLYGYGGGVGYRYPGGYWRISPNVCARFPWLPRWWWADPAYDLAYPSEVDPKAELKRLEAEREALMRNIEELMRNIEELKRHIEEGTPLPSRLQRPPIPYPTTQPENERQLLERQREMISYQLEDIRKRLEELEKEG